MCVPSFRLLFIVFLGCLARTVTAATPSSTIWIEAESAQQKSVSAHSWYNDADKNLLSGGGWLSHFGDEPGKAGYNFQTTKAGKYLLWLRINPKDATVRFRINGAEWKEIISFKAAYDKVNVAANRAADYRFLAWVNVGFYDLGVGNNQLEIEFASKHKNHGALDCICFSADPTYIPVKTFRPGQNRPIHAVPNVGNENFDDWLKFIEPSVKEMAWRTNIRWHKSLAAAALEAKKIQRPILLWAMNGHPCGET